MADHCNSTSVSARAALASMHDDGRSDIRVAEGDNDSKSLNHAPHHHHAAPYRVAAGVMKGPEALLSIVVPRGFR